MRRRTRSYCGGAFIPIRSMVFFLDRAFLDKTTRSFICRLKSHFAS